MRAYLPNKSRLLILLRCLSSKKCPLCMECLSAFASLVRNQYYLKKKKKNWIQTLFSRRRVREGPIMLVLCWPRPPFYHVRLYLLPSSGEVCSGLLLLTSGCLSQKAFNPSIISRLCTSYFNHVHTQVYPGSKLCSLLARDPTTFWHCNFSSKCFPPV